jgi:DNA-binding MarR family transcriptional regulator
MVGKQKATASEGPCSATAMRKASRRLSQLYDEAMAASRIRSTQFAILSELDRHANEPPGMNELAEALVMDRSSLGHNLRPLERDGLVEVKEGDQDRRRRRIILTSRGKAKLAEARILWQVAQDRFNAVFGESNAAALRATLLSIARNPRLTTLSD